MPSTCWNRRCANWCCCQRRKGKASHETRQAIDAADATLFGASGGPSRPVLWYLRWGKQTRANIRPVRWYPGYRSPMLHPERIDYVIVRDNLEGLYPPREGHIAEVLGWIKGMQPEEAVVHEAFSAICEMRRLDKAGYAKFRNWSLYGERALVGEIMQVNIFQDFLTLRT